MALLSVANLIYHLGDRPLLDGLNLTLDPGVHVGLVGRNGCGKSTFMKMLAGLGNHKPDSGQIQFARGASVGYLRQDFAFNPDRTLRQEAGAAFEQLDALHRQLEETAHAMGEADGDALDRLMKTYERLEREIDAAGGYAVDHRIEATLHGLGLTDDLFDVNVMDLSGGQKGRLALAKLLLAEPELLLLDEPTNHLDIAGRQWLENFLADYPGAVMVVSHDRWLLDRVAQKIYELELGRLVEYPGNYTKFREQRATRILEQRRAYDKQQDQIKKEKQFIDKYRAGQRAKQAQGREKRLERFIRDEQLEAPPELDDMKLSFMPRNRSGDQVAVADGLTVRYGDRTLFDGVTLTIRRGDRLGVIGPNGAGKSTLIRCLLGEQEPSAGTAKLGAQVDVGWFRQTHEHLDLTRSVVEYLRPFTDDDLEQQARDLAGAFLFSGDSQDKPLNALSGGERVRAILAGLMAKGHNLLVLDEPTNHLDIPSSERLEEALARYATAQSGYSTGSSASGGNRKGGQGTVILITHDRMLLDRVVDQLLVFDGEGNLQHVLGTYHDYARQQQLDSPDTQAKGGAVAVAPQDAKRRGNSETRTKQQPAAKDTKDTKSTKKNNKAGKGKNNKNRNANKSLSNLSDEKLEGKIEQLETQIAEVDTKLADPETYRDKDAFNELEAKRDKLVRELTPLEAEWTRRAE